MNPAGRGTKAAAHSYATIPAGGEIRLSLRLSREDRPDAGAERGASSDEVFARRISEADEFYSTAARPEHAAIFRQASAGLIWSKQFYNYIVEDWLSGDPIIAPPEGHRLGRNHDWGHAFFRDVMSMPDKWEYPWFAAWDLAFHTIPLSVLDPKFARDQLLLLLKEWSMHPNGQLPAYEYNFGDVNPPVHAWACRQLYEIQAQGGRRDRDFLERCFVRLLLNFTWWVNRKDAEGRNLFTGGFLGLDNIGVFDRSMALPPGATLEQADGTAWMGFFCAEMLSLSLELAREDHAWEGIAVKFFEHFLAIKKALNALGGTGLWDEQDGFYYDQLRMDGRGVPLRVRSLVGAVPLFAVTTLDDDLLARLPEFSARIAWFQARHPDLSASVVSTQHGDLPGLASKRSLLALPTRAELERVLSVLLDEREFLSPFGLRSLSRFHADHPYAVDFWGQHYEIGYVPGESDSSMYGGNSNWRGPVWFPMNVILIEALRTYHGYYGDSLRLEFPTRSGRALNLSEIADALTERLLGLFRPDGNGRRPCHGDEARYARDPNFRELLLFYEYFHGDTGRGCGASHQTGWTGLAAALAWKLARSP